MDTNSLFIIDNGFEAKLTELKKYFHSRMNGEISTQMRSGNLGYDINYGASLMHIKEIAANTEFSTEEYRKLWQLNIREAKIVAIIGYPVEKASTDEMIQWAMEVQNSEIAEISSQYLFSRQNNVNDFLQQLCCKKSAYNYALIFYTAGRAIQRGININNTTKDCILNILNKLDQISLCEQRAISFYCRQIVHFDIKNIQQYINSLKQRKEKSFSAILYDIENEIEAEK